MAKLQNTASGKHRPSQGDRKGVVKRDTLTDGGHGGRSMRNKLVNASIP